MSDHVKTFEFPPQEDTLCVKSFPIVKLDADAVTLSIYGVVRMEGRTLLQGDKTAYLLRGREGIKQPDGRFVFPFLKFAWIPETDQHKEFCFVYNLYKADGTFLGHRRCDSTFVLSRAPAKTSSGQNTANLHPVAIDT